MAFGHLMIGVAAGLLAVLVLAIAGQPLWQMALAYSLVGSLTVLTCLLREAWRMRPTMFGHHGEPGPLRPACAHPRQGVGIKA